MREALAVLCTQVFFVDIGHCGGVIGLSHVHATGSSCYCAPLSPLACGIRYFLSSKVHFGEVLGVSHVATRGFRCIIHAARLFDLIMEDLVFIGIQPREQWLLYLIYREPHL